MKQYLDLVRETLERGKNKTDPQKIGNISIFSYKMRFFVDHGFPLITTKDLGGGKFKKMVFELLWFLSGSTRVTDLHKGGVHYWDQWADEKTCKPLGLETGDLGPIYGKQWRAFDGGGVNCVDQIKEVIANIRRNPDSRRHVVTAWNPIDANKVFVAPCHCFFLFYHAEGRLSLELVQRSADIMVGVPFNTAQYTLLLMMVAQVTGLEPWVFAHELIDAHIYNDQIEFAELQVTREPRPLPRVKINPDVKDIFKFRVEDFELEGYDPHPYIKIPVAY